jgi:hypothetical protein
MYAHCPSQHCKKFELPVTIPRIVGFRSGTFKCDECQSGLQITPGEYKPELISRKIRQRAVFRNSRD